MQEVLGWADFSEILEAHLVNYCANAVVLVNDDLHSRRHLLSLAAGRRGRLPNNRWAVLADIRTLRATIQWHLVSNRLVLISLRASSSQDYGSMFLTGAPRAGLSASPLQELDGKGFAIHALDVCKEYTLSFKSLSETGSNDLPGL